MTEIPDVVSEERFEISIACAILESIVALFNGDYFACQCSCCFVQLVNESRVVVFAALSCHCFVKYCFESVKVCLCNLTGVSTNGKLLALCCGDSLGKFESVGNVLGGNGYELRCRVCVLCLKCTDVAFRAYREVVIVVGGVNVNATVAHVFELEAGRIQTGHKNIGTFFVAFAYGFDVCEFLCAAVLDRVSFAVGIFGYVPNERSIKVAFFTRESSETPKLVAVNRNHASGGIVKVLEVDVVVTVFGVTVNFGYLYRILERLFVNRYKIPHLVAIDVGHITPESGIAVVLCVNCATISGITVSGILHCVAITVIVVGKTEVCGVVNVT